MEWWSFEIILIHPNNCGSPLQSTVSLATFSLLDDGSDTDIGDLVEPFIGIGSDCG